MCISLVFSYFFDKNGGIYEKLLYLQFEKMIIHIIYLIF